MADEPIVKFNLRLPRSLKERLAREAQEKGVRSLNSYIVTVLQLSELPFAEQCDHQPFLDAMFSTCYRCGKSLSVHRT